MRAKVDLRILTSIAIVGLVSACAPLPADLPSRPALLNPRIDAVVPANGVSRTRQENRWWERFGDSVLNRLVVEALQQNPSLAHAQARVRAAQGGVRQAELEADVHSTANAGGTRSRISEHGFLPRPFAGETYNLADVSAQAEYDLDWWGRNSALIAAAGNAAQAAAGEYAAARVAVAALVCDSYFALADAIAQDELARLQVEKRRSTLALERARLKHGLASPQPLREAEQSLARAEDALNRSTYGVKSARYRLAAALGQSPDQANALPVASLPEPIGLPESLPLDWLAQRPDVAAQRSRVELAGNLSDATRAEFYPNVNLMLLVGLESRSASEFLTQGAATGSAGVAIHLPIFNVRSLRNRLGTRESEYAVAVAEYNRTVFEAARQVADSYAALASLARRAEFQREAVSAANSAESLSSSRYRNGLSSKAESLGAEISALGQRQSETETRAARLRAAVALFQSLGGDWEPSQE